MYEEILYQRMLDNEIAINFFDKYSFDIFTFFLRRKGIVRKKATDYYFNKYGQELCVTISESGGFKCGSRGFYSEKGREIINYHCDEDYDVVLM